MRSAITNLIFLLFSMMGFALVMGGCRHTQNTTTATQACEGDYRIESERDLEAIAQCESISGDLRFDKQGWLTSIDLPRLATVVGALYIKSNDALTSVNMPALTTLGDNVHIVNNAALTSLNMPSLTTVDGTLIVGINNTLTSIDLPALTSVNGGLTLGVNNALTNLEGLPNITSVGDRLDIRDNDCLSQAEAEAFAAALTVDGIVSVSSNGTSHPCD